MKKAALIASAVALLFGAGTATAKPPVVSVARAEAAKHGVTGSSWQCLSTIIDRETGGSWSVYETNSSSGAYGLPQSLPGSKMSSAGSDWRSNPATQVRWMIGYVRERYGSPCGAWAFWRQNLWY